LPRSRPEYWLPKLARNQERDKIAEKALAALGLRTLVIWECEVADLETAQTQEFPG
jgi:DNA mismatch endonuclease, patch repair protein